MLRSFLRGAASAFDLYGVLSERRAPSTDLADIRDRSRRRIAEATRWSVAPAGSKAPALKAPVRKHIGGVWISLTPRADYESAENTPGQDWETL